jgi:hypothetical protein
MANYTKATNFAAKDGLPTGNAGKIVKGTEIDTEFTSIASAIASKADSNSPTFTGTPVAPTAAAGTNTTQLATTAFVNEAFKVIQIVSAVSTSATSTTSSSLVDTGLSLSITPTSTSNKILVLITQPLYAENGGFATQVRQALLRDSTVIFDDGSAAQANASNVNRSITFLDSPATVSSVTYKTQMSIPSAAGTIAAQSSSLKSSIVLIEVAA